MRIPRILAALAAVAALGACSRTASDQAVQAAPEKPSAAVASAPAHSLEFVGVVEVEEKVTVLLLDHNSDVRHKIDVGQSSNGIDVLSYDQAKDEVTVKADGRTQLLAMRKERNDPIPVAVGAPMETLPVSLLTDAMASIQVVSSPETAAATSAEAKEEVAPVLDDAAREVAEREARMLVSDLMEISQIHAKAYADKKAEEDAAMGAPSAAQ